MEDALEMSLLLDYYGGMLTEKQRDFITYYYDDDLSLAEIAESENMTRQGVRHIVKKAEQELIFLENKLVGNAGLKLDPDVAELSVTARLLLVSALNFNLLAYGFLV